MRHTLEVIGWIGVIVWMVTTQIAAVLYLIDRWEDS